MADPFAFDNSIDSVLSEGSQSSSHSKTGTPRRAHPALFPKATPTTETQGTIKASRLASPPNRTNSGGISTAFADPPDASPVGATSRRKNSASPPLSTPTNANKNSKGRSSTARRNRMKTRKSISGIGLSEDDSSASENEGGSVRLFEQAFQKFDKNNDGQIAMSDFLLFFDALQQQLPPLSEPLLNPGVREQMLTLMSQAMSQSDSTIFISKEDTKSFYKSIAGKDITQELNERRQGTFSQNGEISSFRGRLEAARLPDLEPVETPRRPSAISPERRTPFGGSFARPIKPRRQQSNLGEGTDDENSDVNSVEPSAELTGNFLASSTPSNQAKKIGHGYFSPPATSPTHSALSFGEFNGGTGIRSQIGSPGFNTSAALEQDLAAVYQELRQKQADYDEKEQELADLKHRAERNREEMEEEISSLNEEAGRLRRDLSDRRQEIVQLNRDKDELRAEAAVYLDQVSEAKKDVEQFQYQHNMDRENILALSQDNQRYAQQAADAIRRVDALTSDLQTVIEQKQEVESQKANLQRKADLITGLHKQIKDLREEQKDREVEIEKLKGELHSRQMDIEILMNGGGAARALKSTGGNRDSIGPNYPGVLSDELGDLEYDDEEDDEEEEEVVTTTKTVKRRKKPTVTKADISTDEPFEIVEKVMDTTERGVQVDDLPPWTAEMGTSMDDDLPVPMFTAETQTDVTVDVGTSLEDHFEALAPPHQIEFSIDEEGLQKIRDYEELAKETELTRQQLKELSQAIGVQSELLDGLQKLGQANARHRVVRKVVQEKLIPGENPIAYLNYTTYWLQNWLFISIKQTFKTAEKGRDEWAEFLEHNARPDFNAVVFLVIFFLSVMLMAFVTVKYTWKIQSHEAMWRRVNTLKGYPRNAGAMSSGALFGSRTWRVFKYDIQRALFGQVRFPV
ncbi:hypothetical protein TWF694_006577 [Orbilia ellipsospora]|uniref:EF-hand domain-containing protein n=1 Tax=Orbilia ellipsospora TaxID=2528407 RepID=A0AAV9XKI3_9PEZI